MTSVVSDLALAGFMLLLVLLASRGFNEWRFKLGSRATNVKVLPAPTRLPSSAPYNAALHPESLRLRHSVWALLALALTVRFGTWLLAWLMHMVQENHAVGFWDSFTSIWGRWDAAHYLDLADHGYVDVATMYLRYQVL